MRRVASRIWVFLEFKAVEDLETATQELWDNRWQMTPQHPAEHSRNLSVRPLGLAGIEQCPDWRATGLPHVVLQSTPSVWEGDRLIAAPVAGFPQNWQAEPGDVPDTFFAALLSH